MRWRRAKTAGARYFFTVDLAARDSSLLIQRIHVLRQAVRHVKSAHPFCIDAMVILPDHLHALWTLPEHDSDYAIRWMLIKTGLRLP